MNGLLHLLPFVSPADLGTALADIRAALPLLVPELYLAALLVIVLLADVAFGKRRPTLPLWVALAGMALQLPLLLMQLTATHDARSTGLFFDMLRLDGFAVLFKLIVWLAATAGCLFALNYPKLRVAKVTLGEFALMLIGLLLGMQLMAQAQHLLMMYLSLELVSLCSYILTVYVRTDEKAGEAAVKFILYGAVSSALMLFGISLLYGLTGTLSPAASAFIPALQSAPAAAVVVAVVLVLAGFAYKTAVVPFHFWAPDVYEGALTPVSAMLSTGTKAAGFAMLARLSFALHDVGAWFGPTLAVVAIVTMTLGNLAALGQHNYKRLLAYSGIANAGFALMGIAVGTQAGIAALAYLLLVYVVMKLAAFIAGSLFAERLGAEDIRSWRGGAGPLPALTLALVVILVSLTGLPPTAGFVAKLYLFIPVWDQYQTTGQFVWVALLVAAVLNTVVSLFYYLRPLVFLILHKPDEALNVRPTTHVFWRNLLVGVAAVLLLVFGVYGFDALFGFVQRCVLSR